jgi:hypothetical protein
MNRALRFRQFCTVCRNTLLVTALVAASGAWGRHPADPAPSSASRYPTTQTLMAGHVTTADLRLHARLKAPVAGWM